MFSAENGPAAVSDLLLFDAAKDGVKFAFVHLEGVMVDFEVARIVEIER